MILDIGLGKERKGREGEGRFERMLIYPEAMRACLDGHLR
jgi:hypothetical protein